MKGAEAYVNDQWDSCGLAKLPQSPDGQKVVLTFIIPADAQFTGLINHICDVGLRHLKAAYPGREVTAEPVAGSVVGNGSGDTIELTYKVGPAA
ncbi:hypothetical protein DN824_13795 [Stutzerimonas nosocomialis]|uniref:Uncharacterized protein n=1 Tax=Stutzerimonas nosocomialis TaxID=1056496 RepID=A0A5R9QAH7_9GAMM|nr:hypothetical protein [Stutzerimonas nosocomialis]TLX53965.1 hypothetical protein DN826_16165 [Stutzerimonas nosocomialis]TLX56776.1 hypothetical protein DN824_13795 [Stutzerimonas nosocomialis]TLX62081.1 hypothetical protein DN820_17880 [Stutzerimonas nosocomialis]